MSEAGNRLALLSRRQREILEADAERLSSKEIAHRLGLSPATVDSHIAAAIQKLNVRSWRDAALLVISEGVRQTGVGEQPLAMPESEKHHSRHHGENLLPQPPPVLIDAGSDILAPSIGRPSSTFRHQGDDPDPAARSGMGAVLIRYLLDGLYITFFFAVMSAVAFGAHVIVIVCERSQIDQVVLIILRTVSYVLAALDAIGVVTATGLLIFRFVLALVRADD